MDTITATTRVFVYFNLHRKVWSVRALNGPNKGRVIAHAVQVGLAEVSFRVSEAGRQRVLRERKKNVHAGVAGTLLWVDTVERPWTPAGAPADAIRVSYNPYAAPTFTEVETHARLPVKSAVFVMLHTDRKVYALDLA